MNRGTDPYSLREKKTFENCCDRATYIIIHVYIYIYIERERDVCMYIYIYIYIYMGKGEQQEDVPRGTPRDMSKAVLV